MTREELLNGYKEDVRDFAKECVHSEGELDATFFDNWAEHFTNLAERLRRSLPEGLEEAAEKHSHANMYDGWDYERIYNAFIAGAEWDKAKMMEKAVEAEVNTYKDLAAGKSWAEFVVEMPTNSLGDKVKLIVIPE